MHVVVRAVARWWCGGYLKGVAAVLAGVALFGLGAATANVAYSDGTDELEQRLRVCDVALHWAQWTAWKYDEWVAEMEAGGGQLPERAAAMYDSFTDNYYNAYAERAHICRTGVKLEPWPEETPEMPGG